MADAPPTKVAALAELGVRTASLVHELRQPLFALKGRLQLALGAEQPPPAEELAELLAQVESMEELLQYYAALATGGDRPVTPRRPFDLRDPVQRAVTLIRDRAVSQQVKLVVELDEGPVPVAGRPMAARQITLNLLHNALDAVGSSARRHVAVRVDGAWAEGVAHVVVQDSGPGVARDLGDDVFEPFVTTKVGAGAVGLGLFIARRLTEELSGALALEHAGSHGTRAVVSLPLLAGQPGQLR